MNKATIRRAYGSEFSVDHGARPGWVTGAERVPGVGEEVFCTAGPGEISAVLGRTGDGSRLLEIRLPDEKAKPFFAAASNTLVAAVPGPKAEETPACPADGSGAVSGEDAIWLR